jgi:hypothetical protein
MKHLPQTLTALSLSMVEYLFQSHTYCTRIVRATWQMFIALAIFWRGLYDILQGTNSFASSSIGKSPPPLHERLLSSLWNYSIYVDGNKQKQKICPNELDVSVSICYMYMCPYVLYNKSHFYEFTSHTTCTLGYCD